MPTLPGEFQYLFYFTERLVVPLVMLWFVFRWSGALSAGKTDEEEEEAKHETEEQRKLRVKQETKTKSAARKGLGAGMMLTVLILFFFSRFYSPGALPISSGWNGSHTVGPISGGGALAASLVGLLLGVAVRVTELPRVKKWLRTSSVAWGVLVTIATSTGLASLAIYYAGEAYYAPHDFLVWGYVSLLCFHLIAFLFGD